MKIILAVLALIGITAVGVNLNGSDLYDAGANNFFLGAVSYPTSLDSFTNPGATDSVATVSHSAQHSNANDAIEALEAKLGTRASTPITNSVLVGLSTLSGTSIWSTYATTTSLVTDILQTGTLLATGSSTLQNFTFLNATGTNATTTNFFATNASTTKFYGAGLTGGSGCTGSSFLQHNGSTGLFGCSSPTSGQTVASTTQYTGVLVSTTTGMLAGQTAFVSVVFEINAGQQAGLFAKETGQATTTLMYVGAGAANAEYMPLIGTFTSVGNSTVQFYAGTSINNTYQLSGGQRANISVLKF